MRDIYRTHGIRGLYFGGLITSIRDSIGYGFYFWGYESAKLILLNAEDTERTRMGKMLTAGGIAGCITWASVYPLGTIGPLHGLMGRYNQNKVSDAIHVVVGRNQTFDCRGKKIYFHMALCKRNFSTRGITWNV